MSDVGQLQPFPTRTLEQVASRITDGSHFSPTPQEQGYLIANVKDMKSGQIDFDGCTRISTIAFRELKATGCIIKKNNVLLSKDGTVGRVVVYDSNQEIGALSSICLITPKDDQDPRFLGHALQSNDCFRQYENAMSGSALRRLVLRDIRQIRIPAPAVDEQAKIAEILDTLDTTIRQTEAIIEKLKQVKQGLLHDLLTRGIDANGELRPPQSQAPHLYKDSPLGWIPREWEAQRLRNIGESVTGSTPPSLDPLAWGRGLPFITPADVVDDHAINSAQRGVTSRGAAYGRRLPPRTTLVVCIGSTIGKVGITGVEACTNQQINALVPSKTMEPAFVHLAIQRHVDQLRAMAGLQAVPIVNKTAFESLVIPVSPLGEQTGIAARMNAISDRIRQEDTSARKLWSLKAGLMDDLLTGRVRVTSLLSTSS